MATFPTVPVPAFNKTTATITFSTAADGLSNIVDLGGAELSGYSMSTDWTAANMTFLASFSSTSSMLSLYTSTGLEVSHIVAAGRAVGPEAIFRSVFEGVRYIQFRSGTAAVPVAQAAARTLTLGLYKGD